VHSLSSVQPPSSVAVQPVGHLRTRGQGRVESKDQEKKGSVEQIDGSLRFEIIESARAHCMW
jgi:hypothetical protein